MGGVYTPNSNPTGSADFQESGLDELSSGIALGASFENQWNAIVSSASFARGFDLIEAREGRFRAAGGRWGYRQEPDTPIITKEEANKKYGIEGVLSFDQDIRDGEAALINKYRQNQQKIDYTLSRSDPGALNAIARFGAGFAATALDPIGIATSLIPVVGEARFAAMVGRMGLTSARFAKGAIEGAVGAAIVEPLAYMQAQTEHADYTAYDSLVNIAFGGILGAGLQGGVPALFDSRNKIFNMVRRQPGEVRQANLNGALAAVMENRPITVGDTFRFETSRRAELTLGSTLGRSAPVTPMTLARSTPARSGLLTNQLDGGVSPVIATRDVPRVVGFTTAKGSTYEIGEGGATTRNKAARPDIGHEGQSGPQPISQSTFYVTKEDANALSEFQTQGGKKAIAKTSDGRWGVKYLDGPNAGKFEKRTVVSPQQEPSVGLTPVEVFNDGERVHFGNEITEVRHSSDAPDLTRPTERALEPLDQVVREMLENSKRSLGPDPAISEQIIKITDRTSKLKSAPTLKDAEVEATQLSTDVDQLLSLYDLTDKELAEVSGPKDDIDAVSYEKAVKQALSCMVA